MHQCLIFTALWITVPCLLFTLAAGDQMFINCGLTADSVSLNGIRWLGDTHSSISIKGSSSRSTVTTKPTISAHPVPYATARISRSQFSYVFKVSSGQKLIRFHFHPTSYNGFKNSKDLFNVEAGPFTLLSNFSASITADAFAVNFITKEYCMVVEETYPFYITFSPATVNDHKSQDTHAFVNGIELISLPETYLHCHIADSGVQVIGEKFLVHIDNSTAFETVYRQNVKRDSGDDLHGMWAGLAAALSQIQNKVSTTTWRVSVDLGFRYLVRLFFCELGLKLAEDRNTSFVIVINQMVACTSSDILRERGDKHVLIYRDYMVMAKGRKLGGKRDIIISLQSSQEFVYSHGPLKGFEIFKLSNHENSLASPNPLPIQDSPYWSLWGSPFVLGNRNTLATVVIMLICLVNIIVHMLRQTLEDNSGEEEKKPADSITRNCRSFLLPEIQAATDNFNDEFFIGKGGFGKVYKGFIDYKREIVAIKRLKQNSKQGKREFWTEIETLSELRHVNLVSLIGYCNEQQEMILVYEYMPNGTLADHLYKLARKNSKYSILSWEERLKICIGAGRGLDYLHTGKGVIHRDVKSSNILLDETFVAKVSDFGLAKTECVKGLQIQDSTNLKGTFGYIDPDYFRTRKFTTKSDTYAFGVVLLEALCGRPAVDPHAGEDERSLTMWVLHVIGRGEYDRIIDPSLSREISAGSLKAFLGIAERCLHDEPNKRPTMTHVVIHLEIALEQQTGSYLVRNEIRHVAAFLEYCDKSQPGTTTSLLPNKITDLSEASPCDVGMSISTMKLSVASPHVQIMTSTLQKQTTSCRTVNESPYGRKDGRKTIKHRLSRLFPWDGVWKKAKPSKNSVFASISISAPIAKQVNNKTSSRGSSAYQDVKLSTEDEGKDWFKKLRIFSLSELAVATADFDPRKCVGEGGFGPVYKGFLKEISMDKSESGSFIAVKRLDQDGYQGLDEWQSEVNFLGKLSHPNIVTLLGYCCEDKELLLVYEFMRRGSLENHLFHSHTAVKGLSWNLRLKILMGAARGLAFLHTQDKPIIYRDLKPSNILLDESYHVKLSDFGLAKLGPSGDETHLSTRIMGTYGYAAPEYVMTGHLYVQSDIYSFGVILLEMLTGVRAMDRKRPSGQHDLVKWIRPCFKSKRKLMNFMDSRLKGSYPPKAAFQLFQLARTCVNKDPKARSSITQVIETLERSDTVLEKPRDPKVRFSSQINSPCNQ